MLATALLAAALLLPTAQDPAPWRRILERAEALKPGSPDLLKCLEEIDAEAARGPSVAGNHFVRGWILSTLRRDEEAVAAYDRAFALDRTLAGAAYNAGVILSDGKRHREARDRYLAALGADPSHVDAAYNAGQASQLLNEYDKALEHWTTARRLTPEDFEVNKKILQALHALGREDEAAKARERLLELHKASADPKIRKLTQFVFEQFDVDGVHVFAYEAIAPAEDGPFYTYVLTDVREKPTSRILFVSSPELRAAGTPYTLRIRRADKTEEATSTALKERPSVAELRGLVKQLIQEKKLR